MSDDVLRQLTDLNPADSRDCEGNTMILLAGVVYYAVCLTTRCLPYMFMIT